MIRSLIGVLLLVAVGNMRAQAVEGEPYVAVHGSATKTVIPDTFAIDLALSETSKDTGKTSSKIEGRVRSILQIAKEQNIPDVNIDVDQLTIEPDFDWDDEAKKRTFLGSAYTRELHVRFAALDDLRKFVAALPPGDDLQVTVGDFSYNGEIELRRTLLASAIDDAKQTAMLLAEGAGRSLGEVYTISTRGFDHPYSGGFGRGGLGTITVTSNAIAPLVDPMTVLKAGSIDITQDVYIVYRLKD